LSLGKGPLHFQAASRGAQAQWQLKKVHLGVETLDKGDRGDSQSRSHPTSSSRASFEPTNQLEVHLNLSERKDESLHNNLGLFALSILNDFFQASHHQRSVTSLLLQL